MTTAAENKILTQTNAGTPMGDLFREYWIPAAMSSELIKDGEPVRLMLLGEQLIAFRDTNGKVGIMDHRCPHRCASLFFGRNEEGGIRCVYHGWKFDADGNCLDMANVPPHQDFKHKVHAKAYKTAEQNGMVWCYMGTRQANPPPLPKLDMTEVPESRVEIRFTQRECNYLQGVEGELDTSHVGIMHFGKIEANDLVDRGDNSKYAIMNRAPEYKLQETEYGYMYAAYRPAEENTTYWRYGQFLFPFWTMPPINDLSTNVLARAYVPMDDTHCMVVALVMNGAYNRAGGGRIGSNPDGIAGASQNYPYMPNTTDWFGRWKLKLNATNDYGIDREVQRTKSYTGIEGVQMQDQAVQESMGEILDRTLEHLAPSDSMITRVRRQMIRMATQHAKDGSLPPSVDRADLYANVRGGQMVAPTDADWIDAYKREIDANPWQNVGRKAAAE